MKDRYPRFNPQASEFVKGFPGSEPIKTVILSKNDTTFISRAVLDQIPIIFKNSSVIDWPSMNKWNDSVYISTVYQLTLI